MTELGRSHTCQTARCRGQCAPSGAGPWGRPTIPSCLHRRAGSFASLPSQCATICFIRQYVNTCDSDTGDSAIGAQGGKQTGNIKVFLFFPAPPRALFSSGDRPEGLAHDLKPKHCGCANLKIVPGAVPQHLPSMSCDTWMRLRVS